jgi:hypothetical protein
MADPRRLQHLIFRAGAALVIAHCSIFVAAQQPPQPIVRITGMLSSLTPVNGDAVRVDVTVANDGPGRISSVASGVRIEGGYVVGVRCGSFTASAYRSDASCWQSALAAGAQASYSVDIEVGNSAEALVIDGAISTYSYGSIAARSTDSTKFRIAVPVAHPDAVVDLAITAGEEPQPIPLATPFVYRTTVTNLGPAEATNVRVVSEDPWSPILPSDISGADCALVEWRTVCRVASLPAGAQATIRYTRRGETYPTQERRSLFVVASHSYDPVAENSSLERQVVIGLAAELARVLVPIVIWPTAGANGSLWVSEFSMFVDGSEELFVFPTTFDCPVLCPAPPLYGSMIPPRRVTEPRPTPYQGSAGILLRVDKSRAAEITFASRIRDTSRALDTWGTAIPVVTDDELVRGRLQLIDVGAGPRFRQTLRIYEPDATGASVRVRVWGDDGNETLLGDETIVLAVPAYNQRDDANAGLPYSPGYAQLDFAAKFPSASQYPRLRIEVEPISDATRYWAFVSITNNETQHVTLVTPEAGGRR